MNPLNAQQIAALLKKQGFAKEKIPTMTAIALAESGGRPEAFNPKGLDKSYGLFQVNMYGGLGPARMKQFGLKQEKELFNPETNVRAAKQILGSQGLGAWSVYKSGKYKEFLPQAQKAVQALGSDQAQQPTQPPSTGAQGKGKTFIIYGNDATMSPFDFLRGYKEKMSPLGSGFDSSSMVPSVDPVALLTKAMFQAPNYLGETA
jgi:hypothetical protein